jgi:hypothetical protein
VTSSTPNQRLWYGLPNITVGRFPSSSLAGFRL